MCGPTNIKPAKQANEPLPSAAVREYTSQKFARGMTAFGWRDPCFGKDVASIPDIVNYQEPRGGARLKIPFPAPVELVDKIKRDNQKAGKEPSQFVRESPLAIRSKGFLHVCALQGALTSPVKDGVQARQGELLAGRQGCPSRDGI